MLHVDYLLRIDADMEIRMLCCRMLIGHECALCAG